MKWKEFFYLQKSDRQVILVLLSIILVAFTLLYILGERKTTGTLTNSQTTEKKQSATGYSSSGQRHQNSPTELFPFDPNTADSTQLLRLGLSPWQVKNIYRYRESGGVYSRPSDFARLYGLTVKQYRMLEPYIRISPDYLPASTLFPKEDHRRSDSKRTYPTYDSNEGSSSNNNSVPKYSPKLSPGETIVLNMADTAELKRVPGIGSYFARAIMRYGIRLGGYIRVEQLREINGFPEEALPYFTIENPKIRQLNVNQLTLEELRRHPYINFYQARAILDYRRLHGLLKRLDDLKLLKEFPPEAIKQLKPYVCF